MLGHRLCRHSSVKHHVVVKSHPAKRWLDVPTHIWHKKLWTLLANLVRLVCLDWPAKLTMLPRHLRPAENLAENPLGCSKLLGQLILLPINDASVFLVLSLSRRWT